MDARNVSPQGPGGPAPACSVCGRQDETLRVVAYPYVFSLLVITFRRAFIGLWCSRDRLPWSILAGLISATVGWIGIPFGLFFTPATLYRLARGGRQPAEPNLRLLDALAEHKLRGGDPEGATRCLEASFQFRDDPATRERLRNLYATHRSFRKGEGKGQALAVAGALLGSAVVGMASGALDHVVGGRFSSLLGDEASIYLVILSWAITAATAFVGALLVRLLVAWALARARCHQVALALGVATCAVLLALYGLPGGRMLAQHVELLLSRSPLAPAGGLLLATGAVLTRGGLLEILNAIRSEGSAGTIYLLILLGSAAFYGVAGISAAVETATWQGRLAAVEQEAPAPVARTLAPARAGFAGALLGLALLVSLFPQQGLVDHIEAIDHAGRGARLLGEDRPDAALAELEQATRLRPRWALGRVLLGRAHQARGDDEQAATELREAVRLDPALAVAHRELGLVCLNLHAVDEAVGALQEAARRDPDDAVAHLYLGLAYTRRGEFKEASEEYQAAARLQPRWGAPHALLAEVWYQTGEEELTEQTLRQAEELAGGDAFAHYALGLVYYDMHDLSRAETHLLKAAELAPALEGYHAALAELYSAQERYDLALQHCDRALELRPGYAPACDARAGVYANQGKLEQALAELSSATLAAPREPSLHSSLSDVYLRLGQADKALQAAEEAVRLDRYDVTAQASLALACHALGQIDRARAAAREAARLVPRYDTPHYALGLCHAAQGETKEAVAEFEAFLALYWDRPQARAYKARAEEHLARLR